MENGLATADLRTAHHHTAAAMAFDPLDDLSKSLYVADVLRSDTTEDQLEQDLITRAASLGISLSRPSSANENNNGCGTDSDESLSSAHARNTSTGSDSSARTAITPTPDVDPHTHAQPPLSTPRSRSRTLHFSVYDKYLTQVGPNLCQPKFLRQPSTPSESTTAIFTSGPRKSYASIKNGIRAKVRWKRQPAVPGTTISCICCRDDFTQQSKLYTLPCGHTYCGNCLRIMITQSTTDESKMPPRCCTQPIPAATIRAALLAPDDQQAFLKAVQQFSTPWEARIFCPNPTCNEFIPPRARIDPKHPFDVVCRECRSRVCIWCKRDAHPLGQDCPHDLELDQVLRMGEKSGWRRCYKCRTLVELTQGCTHMTCRCKAQFCYICGAVWDPVVGCPNFCNGEEELERRRLEEAAREAEVEASKAAAAAAAAAAELELQEADKRTSASAEFRALRADQEEEMSRFQAFERSSRWALWATHDQRKALLNEKYTDQMDKMKERHAKTEQHLEERQIAAEMELRASLDQAEKSVRIKVRHMEAYCAALYQLPAAGGEERGPAGDMPPRVVTERHLRELGQQHSALEGMARLHQARINVLRDRQAKRMEELLERQEHEIGRLAGRRGQDLEDLAAESAHEEDALARMFDQRKTRLVRRWELAIEILRAELEKKDETKYGLMAVPTWPIDVSPLLSPSPSVSGTVRPRHPDLAATQQERQRSRE